MVRCRHLRATTTIRTALGNGVEAIIPVASGEEARRLKSEGYLVASEKDGVQPDFADLGNSAFSFTRERVGGKTVVYCTTNGTRALEIAKGASGIAIGAFINISALTGWLAAQQRDVVVLCSGWKNKFCLEDALFAGALTRRLLETGLFRTECDRPPPPRISGVWPRTTYWDTSRRPPTATACGGSAWTT